MDSAQDANALPDYVEFQIFPTQNRYDAWVCYGTKKEKVSSGRLEHLLLHSDDIKSLHLKGSNAKYKLPAPENSDDIKWFKRSTLIRFLHMIGSEGISDVTNSLKNEIFQLEEARKFQISLYTKDIKYPLQSGQSDGSISEGTYSTTHAEGLDSSKNELLRAMDLRLTALKGELVTVFDQACGSQYSLDEMIDIQKLSLLFRVKALSDSLCKYIELRRDPSCSSKHFSESDKVELQELSNQTNKSSSSETPVKYGPSPAKAAQAERQSSTESEDESSLASDQERRPSVERSRALVRSASPRRSASPMRRVQIGRSGYRRPTAITIKSLNCFPARERSFFPREEDHSGGKEPEQEPENSESNVGRMSVQDAIHLFESKQRDQRADVQKAKSLLNGNKSVLRRWSSGMGEGSSQYPHDSSLSGTEFQNNVKNNESRPSSSDFGADYPVEALEDVPLENGACSLVLTQEESLPTEVQTEVNEISNASAEWSRLKEAELNELFMKMMETKPIKGQADVAAVRKRQSLPSKQRAGSYDHYKEERVDQLREQADKVNTEKGKQSRSTQQTFDQKKSKRTPTNESDENKKGTVKKLQNPVKRSLSQPSNPKKEKSPRPGVKKDSSKASSSLPTTRKSWPSIPSARAAGLSPAKTPPTTFTNPTPTRRRPQPTPPKAVSQSSTRVETSPALPKSVKTRHNDRKKSPKTDPEKKQQSLMKPRKTAKSKGVVENTPPKDLALSTKPSLLSKVSKKSSVVPLESKPFLRKGSKTTTSGTNPVLVKPEIHSVEQLREPEDLKPPEENAPSLKSSDPVSPHQENKVEESNIEMGMKLGPIPNGSPDKREAEVLRLSSPTTDFVVDRLIQPDLKSEAEDELTISPRAWVEMEECEDQSIIPIDHDIDRIVDSPPDITLAEVPSPRVRNSLSQMLLEESSEPDFVDCGNTENQATMVYQKDAPKGLKRLLKFARKSKNEVNATGWLSPSVISGGEYDADDSRVTSKRSSETLLRKATLQSKNNSHQKSSADYEHPGFSLTQHFQQGPVSASVPTTKATRLFFSLSAFKGSK